MTCVGDGAMELGSPVSETEVWVAAGVVAWPEHAAKTMKTGMSAHIGSLVIRVLLSFGVGIGARLHIHNERA